LVVEMVGPCQDQRCFADWAVEIRRPTVANMLAEAGIEAAPERETKRTWKRSVKAHWDPLCACGFFRVEVSGLGWAVRYMVCFVVVLKTRTMEIARIGVNPDRGWMKQMARNLTERVGWLTPAGEVPDP
jgi:hypothetical protein